MKSTGGTSLAKSLQKSSSIRKQVLQSVNAKVASSKT